MKGFAVVKPPVPQAVTDQIQQADADARSRFARDVDALLVEIRAEVDALPEDHFTRLTRYEAWGRLRQRVIEKFDHPARSLETVLLTQLVREAYSLLNHQDETTVDLRDWSKAAEPFVRS